MLDCHIRVVNITSTLLTRNSFSTVPEPAVYAHILRKFKESYISGTAINYLFGDRMNE